MLKPSKKVALALEAVVDIAYYGGSEPVQSQGIADRLNVPRRYLEQVMQQLVKARILKGVRGPRGGYRLARERRRITVGEVLRIVEGVGPSDEMIFQSPSALGTEVMSGFWREMAKETIKRLDSITIADLCKKASAHHIQNDELEVVDFVI